MTFRVAALPRPVSQASLDTAERVIADVSPGYPCRRCLCDAEVGDTLLLLAYDPFHAWSPYSGTSPIYLHEACVEASPDVDEVPEQQRRRLLSLRGYDDDHRLREAVVIPGVDLEGAITAMFDVPPVSYLHVHNAGPGCFAVRVDRLESGQP